MSVSRNTTLRGVLVSLNMSLLSTGTLKMTLRVVELAGKKSGKITKEDILLIIGKDPHHEINNGIRLGFLEREKNIIRLTEIGKAYIKSEKDDRAAILRDRARKIRIVDVCVLKLELNGRLTEKEIINIWKNITGRDYTEKTQSKQAEITINWLINLGFAGRAKDGTLKWTTH
jgi:hypothetical protein